LAAGATLERLTGASAFSCSLARHPAPYSNPRPTRPEGKKAEGGGAKEAAELS